MNPSEFLDSDIGKTMFRGANTPRKYLRALLGEIAQGNGVSAEDLGPLYDALPEKWKEARRSYFIKSAIKAL